MKQLTNLTHLVLGEIKECSYQVASIFFNASPTGMRALLMFSMFFCGIFGIVTEDINCNICHILNGTGVLLAIIEFIGFGNNKVAELINTKLRMPLFYILMFYGVGVVFTEAINVNTSSDRFFLGSLMILILMHLIIFEVRKHRGSNGTN